jgi:hypothetical protein
MEARRGVRRYDRVTCDAMGEMTTSQLLKGTYGKKPVVDARNDFFCAPVDATRTTPKPVPEGV